MEREIIQIGLDPTDVMAEGTRYSLRLSDGGGLHIRCARARPGFHETISIEPEASNTITIRPKPD